MRNLGILLGILSIGLVIVAFVGISSVSNYGSIAQLQAETNEILMDLFIVIVALILAVFSGALIISGNSSLGTSSVSTDGSETGYGENLKEQTEQEIAEEPDSGAIGVDGAVEVYKGQAIHEIPGGFTAMGSWFKSIDQAKSYIDNNL